MIKAKHFLDLFFYPKSVAVVGASRNERTNNYHLAGNLVKLGFPGRVYPVNPNATEILGLKAYPDVTSIEDDVDLAVISVPARSAPDVVRDCIAKKVKGITIVAGGFSETGPDGNRLQDEIRALLSENGIRAVGPNALSPVNSANSFIIGFTSTAARLPRGGLSIIFQSGFYQPRLNWLAFDVRLRLCKLLDLGNKMDINEVDALEYLAQDDDTRVIALHMESIAGDARRLMSLMRETTPHKPVIVLKSGRTTAGARAAQSHTGALMKSTDTIVDSALKQAGAIRAQGMDEFFDLSKAFEYLPPPRGNRVAISTFSGGEGVLTTDAVELNGLEVARPGEESRRKLSELFPPWEIPLNPFDAGVAGQFHSSVNVIEDFVEAGTADPNVDCLAVQVGGPPRSPGRPDTVSEETAMRAYHQALDSGKPVVAWTVDASTSSPFIQQLDRNGVPVFASAERAIRALGAVWRYWARRRSNE